MKFCARVQRNDHLQGSTQTLKQQVCISARRANLNYLEVKQSFIQGAGGQVFMLQLKMMRSYLLKIGPLRLASELKCAALLATHILDMSLKAKALIHQQINAGVLILFHSFLSQCKQANTVHS